MYNMCMCISLIPGLLSAVYDRKCNVIQCLRINLSRQVPKIPYVAIDHENYVHNKNFPD